ncbi:MAG: ECF transporter S component [Clostridiales bacterium]|jgi:riboflavin transporter FmnP|nr:ECF transporter S component [Clostridiales bacterium]
MKHSVTKNLTLSAMFIAIGIVLPFLTMQIPEIGNMLLPMHIPVLLCGLICGWKYGLTVGIILPLMRSFIFTMPPMYPVAIAMAFELAAYGLIIGLVYNRSRWQCIVALYRSMLIAMLSGRVVWGAAMIILLGVRGGSFTWETFMSGAFITAFPGIIAQLIIIPAVMVALNRTGLVRFYREKPAESVVEN